MEFNFSLADGILLCVSLVVLGSGIFLIGKDVAAQKSSWSSILVCISVLGTIILILIRSAR